MARPGEARRGMASTLHHNYVSPCHPRALANCSDDLMGDEDETPRSHSARSDESKDGEEGKEVGRG